LWKQKCCTIWGNDVQWIERVGENGARGILTCGVGINLNIKVVGASWPLQGNEI